jgi:hypothetical protein
MCRDNEDNGARSARFSCNHSGDRIGTKSDGRMIPSERLFRLERARVEMHVEKVKRNKIDYWMIGRRLTARRFCTQDTERNRSHAFLTWHEGIRANALLQP